MLQKAAAINRFEYFSLRKELKKQTSVAENSTKNLTIHLRIKTPKPSLKKYNRSNLIYRSKDIFDPYYDIKNFRSISLVSKYLILFSLYSELNKFNLTDKILNKLRQVILQKIKNIKYIIYQTIQPYNNL